jgi:hypothetical protein
MSGRARNGVTVVYGTKRRKKRRAAIDPHLATRVKDMHSTSGVRENRQATPAQYLTSVAAPRSPSL